jgi:hypothetical protein
MHTHSTRGRENESPRSVEEGEEEGWAKTNEPAGNVGEMAAQPILLLRQGR